MINLAVVVHRLSSVVNHWKSTEADGIYLENHRITVDELASELTISVGSAFIISHFNTAKFALNGYPAPGTKEVEPGTK